jgi:hypothetical protein
MQQNIFFTKPQQDDLIVAPAHNTNPTSSYLEP